MKDKILNLIGSGKTGEAIKLLLSVPELKEAASIIKSSFDDLKRNEMLGILSFSEVSRESSKINSSIINLVNTMKKNDNTILKQMIADEKYDEVFDILQSDAKLLNDILLLKSRYKRNNTQMSKHTIDSRDYSIELNRINIALGGYIDEYSGALPEISKVENKMENTVMTYLKALLADTKLARLRPDLYEKVKELKKQFEEYDEKKNAPGSIYDSSGRIKDMLNAAYQNLKTELSETNKDGKEDFEEFVNSKLGSEIPSWNMIDEVYVIAVGRKFQNDYIERCLKNRPADDMAKLECVDLIVNWTKNYLK